MNKPKVYIAGKVTGLTVEEYTRQFRQADNKLFAMGFLTFNPIDHVPESTSWHKAMRMCIRGLMDCDFIFLLPGWTASKGAIIERIIAMLVKIPRIKIYNYENKD